MEYCNVQCASCGATLRMEPMKDGMIATSGLRTDLYSPSSEQDQQQQDDYDYYDDY